MQKQIDKSLINLAYRNYYYFSIVASMLWIIYIGFDYLFSNENWIRFLPIRIIGFSISIASWYYAKNKKLNIYLVQNLIFIHLIFSLTIFMSYVGLPSLSIYYTGYGMVIVLCYVSFILKKKHNIMYFFVVIFSFISIFYFSPFPIYTHLGLGVYAIISELVMMSVVNYALNNARAHQFKAQILLKESHLTLEQKQKEILDSIHYAKRIQSALLANKSIINKEFSENFIFFNPKDIVSGDFYWATKHGDNFYLAVCDSTGHGVPGAFMSLLNIGFLSEAINEKNITETNLIFDYVREKLISSISKEGQKDGFDGIILCVNKKTNELTYTAANNAPILISNNELLELRKDKIPVGMSERNEKFTCHKLDIKKGDMLYLYTDGYADQFGGPKGKKFKYKPLNDLLLSISNNSLEKQKQELETNFKNWKGNLEQVDDVCVIGIRIN